MANIAKAIALPFDNKMTLETLLQQKARKYVRAKILLLKDSGNSNELIADKLGITVPINRHMLSSNSLMDW